MLLAIIGVVIVPTLPITAVSGGPPPANELGEPSLLERGPAPGTLGVEAERPRAARFSAGTDEEIRPAFPPIAEILPLEMPIEQELIFAQDGEVGPGVPVLHDASTGETTMLEELFGASGPPVGDDGQGGNGGGYHGSDGGPGEEGEIFGAFGSLAAVSFPWQYPWRMNCKLVLRFEDAAGNDQWRVCSASMYDAETVLTAGHCVFNRQFNWGWAKEIWVIPGWDGEGNIIPIDSTMQHYGWARSTQYSTWTSWTENGDFDADVGIIRLERAVGMLTGWYGWHYGGDCDFHRSKQYHNISYPAESCGEPGLHNGRDMYYWHGAIDNCPDNQLELTTSGGCFDAVWGGMSGSGMYFRQGEGRYIHAVCSRSDRATWGRYCRQWEAWITFVTTSFIPQSRGSVFDLQPLDTNVEPAVIEAGERTTALDHLAANPTNGVGSGTFSYSVYLSTNDNISGQDTLLATQTMDWNFAAMSSVRVFMDNVRIPEDTPPGDYWIGVLYDGATDGNSGNNDTDGWDAAPVRVTCPASIAPVVRASDGAFCDRIDVTWTDTDGSVAYKLYRDGIDLTGWQAGTSYSDINATPGTVHTYSVRSRNACGSESGLLEDDGYLCLLPENDECAFALPVAVGSWPFSTLHATTDGPAEPDCHFCCGDDQIGSDVWYRFVANGTGRVNISLCDSDYDTKIGVYEGGCPGEGSLIGCNDATCNFRSVVDVFVEDGVEYLIRIGGFGGARGSGTMVISFDSSEVDRCLGVDRVEVLKINGATGSGNGRIVARPFDGAIDFEIEKPGAGGNGKFVVHMNAGIPTNSSRAVLPAGLGVTCFQMLYPSGAAPSAVWTNFNKPDFIGKSNLFGSAIPDPQRAPTTFYSAGVVPDFPIFTAWTIQGVILNPASSSHRGASVTNPVILDVLP